MSRAQPVVFRTNDEDGKVIAVFPGQAHTAYSAYIAGITRPATPDEYADMKSYLEEAGHKLRVCLSYEQAMAIEWANRQ